MLDSSEKQNVDSLAFTISQMNIESSLLVGKEVRSDTLPQVPVYKLLTKPVATFFISLLMKNGFRSGTSGLIEAATKSLFALMLWGKRWEYRLRLEEKKNLFPPTTDEELSRWKSG